MGCGLSTPKKPDCGLTVIACAATLPLVPASSASTGTSTVPAFTLGGKIVNDDAGSVFSMSVWKRMLSRVLTTVPWGMRIAFVV